MWLGGCGRCRQIYWPRSAPSLGRQCDRREQRAGGDHGGDTKTASCSDGSPFTGTLSFEPPYSDDQDVFAISGNNLIMNPSGPGLTNEANTVQDVTKVVTFGAKTLLNTRR
jgi:hypothetical protein